MKHSLLVLLPFIFLFCQAQTEETFKVEAKRQGVYIFPEIDTLNAGGCGYAFNVRGMDIKNVDATVSGATSYLTNKSIWINTPQFIFPNQKIILQIRDKRDTKKQVLYTREFVLVPLLPSPPLTGPYARANMPFPIYLDKMVLTGTDTINLDMLAGLQTMHVGLGPYKPRSFVMLIGKNATIKLHAKGGDLSPQMKAELRKLKAGDRFTIDEVNIRPTENWKEFTIGPFEFYVKN